MYYLYTFVVLNEGYFLSGSFYCICYPRFIRFNFFSRFIVWRDHGTPDLHILMISNSILPTVIPTYGIYIMANVLCKPNIRKKTDFCYFDVSYKLLAY